jgi:RNA polymerase sigma factor (sigma-70 family)
VTKPTRAGSGEDRGGPLSQLAERAKSGERAALEEFAAATRRFIVLAIRTRMTKELRRRTEVDEIANAAWASIQRNLSRLRVKGERSLLAWLGSVARSRVVDALRPWRNKSRGVHQNSGALSAAVSSGDHVRDFWTRVDAKEVMAALEQLPRDLAEVVWSIDYEGCSIAAVARATGRSKSAVQRLHARARAKLSIQLRTRP